MLYLLSFQADLENVSSIKFDAEKLVWCVDVKHPTSEDTRNRVLIDPKEQLELLGSRGTANFALKWPWPGSHKQASISLVTLKSKTASEYTEDDAGKFVAVAAFECRGLDLIRCYSPNEGLTVISKGQQIFEDVDLTNNEWCGFDEQKNIPVGVYNVQWKFDICRV